MRRNPKNKYSARKTVSHGITFDSAAEAKYYPVAVKWAETHQYLQEVYGQNRVKQISIEMAKENGGQSVFDRRKYRGVSVDV